MLELVACHHSISLLSVWVALRQAPSMFITNKGNCKISEGIFIITFFLVPPGSIIKDAKKEPTNFLLHSVSYREITLKVRLQ